MAFTYHDVLKRGSDLGDESSLTHFFPIVHHFLIGYHINGIMGRQNALAIFILVLFMDALLVGMVAEVDIGWLE